MADYPISNVPRRVQYVNTGVGPYSFNFEILTQTDIAVYRGDSLLVLTNDYTVTINSNGTGSVTLTTAGTGNITIVGARAIQRSSDYTTNGDLFASTLNTDLDSQTIYSQQLAETLGRTVKSAITDATTLNMNLPTALTRSNKVFGFKANGEPTVSSVTVDQLNASVGAAIANPPTNAANLFYSKITPESPSISLQSKLRQGAKNVKDYGALGDGTGRTPADDGIDITNAAWNTWEGRAFKTNPSWSPWYANIGNTFQPPRAKPFSNTDTWDFIGISLALWDEESSTKATYIPAGKYIINLSGSPSKGLYYNGLLLMKGMEQTIFGDGPYETEITTKENPAFFLANNLGTANAYSIFCFYRIGGPPSNIYDMAIVGPDSYDQTSKNLTLILCQNINGVTFRDLWLSVADNGISVDTSSGDSHASRITSEFLFSNTIVTDASSEITVDFCNFWASATVVGQRGVNGAGRVSVTNSRLVGFYSEGVKGASGIVSNNYFTLGSTVMCQLGEGVINNNQFVGSTNASLLFAGNNSSVTGNYFSQAANHPCLNLGNGTTATNITVTGNTFIKTNSASEAQNYAIIAEVTGSSFTGAATESVLINNNTFQGRALTSLADAKFGLNSFGGVARQGALKLVENLTVEGDVLGKRVVTGTNANASYTITVTGLLGQGQGNQRDMVRVNLVVAISTATGHVVRGAALYTSQFNGNAVLYATLGTSAVGGTITFGSSGSDPTVAITNSSGNSASYEVYAIPLI